LFIKALDAIYMYSIDIDIYHNFPFAMQRGAGGGGGGGNQGGSAFCQKCLQQGHWTHQCKNERAYVSRKNVRFVKVAQKHIKALEIDDY
jgi:hypothetical protein